MSVQLANLEITNGTAQFYLGQSQRVWNLVNKHPIFAEIIQHPKIISAIEYLLGEDCILSFFTVNRIAPDQKMRAYTSIFHSILCQHLDRASP